MHRNVSIGWRRDVPKMVGSRHYLLRHAHLTAPVFQNSCRKSKCRKLVNSEVFDTQRFTAKFKKKAELAMKGSRPQATNQKKLAGESRVVFHNLNGPV
jgi:hypothetical protein